MSEAKFTEVLTVGLQAILQKVARQASDPGLWIPAQSAVEEYLQQELRYLHAIIETVIGSDGVDPRKSLPPFWELLESSVWQESGDE